MDQFDFSAQKKAEYEMKILRNTVNPLAAVLLIADFSHPELEHAISKLHPKEIARMDLRLNVVFQLLQNQKSKFYRPQNDMYSGAIRNRYDREYCDFKEVMEILGKSRMTVETLIKKKKINAIQNKPGEKRGFVRDEILKYARGVH